MINSTQINSMWYIYIVEYSSAMKRMKYTICSNMDWPEIILTTRRKLVLTTRREAYMGLLRKLEGGSDA